MRFKLFLLLAILIVSLVGIAATEDQPADPHSTIKQPRPTVGNETALTREGSEERGGQPTILSRINVFSGKSERLSSKPISVHKTPQLLASFRNIPVLKKLESAVLTNPKFFTNLKENPGAMKAFVKNPEVVKVAGELEKQGLQITTKHVNLLRSAVSKDPAQAARLKDGFWTIDNLMEKVVMPGIVVLTFLLIASVVWDNVVYVNAPAT